MASKYIPVKVDGIILSINVPDKKVEGFSESILSVQIPDNLENASLKKQKHWIKENNIRMEAICQFMNENNL